MLDYVIRLCLDKGQDHFLEFPNELTEIDKASRAPAREVTIKCVTDHCLRSCRSHGS